MNASRAIAVTALLLSISGVLAPSDGGWPSDDLKAQTNFPERLSAGLPLLIYHGTEDQVVSVGACSALRGTHPMGRRPRSRAPRPSAEQRSQGGCTGYPLAGVQRKQPSIDLDKPSARRARSCLSTESCFVFGKPRTPCPNVALLALA